MEIVPDPAFF
jgi:hypothetical protein